MNTYYGKEEEHETTQMQIDNLHAQAMTTESVDGWARETLAALYDQSLAMWNQVGELQIAAQQRGDYQTAEQLLYIQNNINMLYQGTEQLQQALLSSNAGSKTVIEAAEALAKQKQSIEEELTTLVTAVEEGDYNHPQVQQLMENVEEDVYEMVSEGAFEEAYESAAESVYDNLISELYTVIREVAPLTSYAIAERFFLLLKGDYRFDSAQQRILAQLVSTITLEGQPYDND